MENTTLYRFFDKDDRLLYVGISKSYVARLHSHIQTKDWITEAVRCTLEHFEYREEAAEAEIDAIQFEKPLHNIQHASDYEQHRISLLRLAHDLESNELIDEWHMDLARRMNDYVEWKDLWFIRGSERWEYAFMQLLPDSFRGEDEDPEWVEPCKLCVKAYHRPSYRFGVAEESISIRDFMKELEKKEATEK